MKTHSVLVVTAATAILAVTGSALAQSPANSTITYQGRLALNGLAVNEDCDVVFNLYDAATGGNLIAQVGSEAAPRLVSVRKGLFTQPLDFGAGAFTGGERWLEIAVRPAGVGGPYSVLTPRQCVTPTPYALHALSGGDVSSLDQAYNKGGPGAGRTLNASNGPLSIEGDGGLVVSGNLGIGTQTPASKLEVAGMVHSTNGGFRFPDGTVQSTASSAEPRGGPFNLLSDDGGGIAEAVWVETGGDVGIGIRETNGDTPGSRLHVADQFAPILTLELDHDDQSALPFGLLGVSFESGNALTNPVLGDISIIVDPLDFLVTPLYINGATDQDVIIAGGGGNVGIGTLPNNLLTVAGDADFIGNVGIGIDVPAQPLHVVGNARVDGNLLITGGGNGITFPDFTVQTTAATAGGDITAVNAGLGLTGGGDTGDVTLNVDFTGSNGANNAAARSDHTHDEVGGGAIVVDGGNVGIGTPTPMFELDVVGDIHATGSVQASAFGSNSPFVAEAPAGTPRLRIDDVSGFVSIGSPPNAAPAHPLDVVGDIHATQKVLASAFASNSPFIAEAPAGTERMRIDDATGNVGIGLSPVNTRLHVLSSATAFLTCTMEGSRTTGTWLALGNTDPVAVVDNFWQLISTGAGNGEGEGKLLFAHGTTANFITGVPMVMDSVTNNVGIGTSSPDPDIRLHVVGTSDVSGVGGGFLQLGVSTGFNIGIDNNEIQGRNNLAPFRLALNASGGDIVIGNSVTPDLGGNLGIGTSTPGTTIEAIDSQAVARLISLTGAFGSVVELRNNAPAPTFLGAINFSNSVGAVPGQIAYRFDNQLVFGVNSAEAMRINQSGDVGIGTPMPGERLHVAGDAQVEGALYASEVSSRDGTSTLELQINDTPHLHIQTDGKIGIGAPPPTGPLMEALEVNGCIKADCIKITADTVVEISPLMAVRAGTGLDLQPSSNGTMRVRPLSTGIQNVMIPVVIPTTVFGVQQRLKSLEVCYRVTSPTSFITTTRFRVMGNAASFTNLIDDPTDQKLTAWTCYTLPAAAVPPFPTVDGPSFIHLEMSFAGASSSYDIEIGRIKVTLTEGV